MTATGQSSPYLLAVDLGGTKVAAALVTRQGDILLRIEEPTCQLGPQQGIAQIAGLLTSLLSQAGVAPTEILGIGIGIPAVLEAESDRVIWGPNLNGWRDVALRPGLEKLLGIPVYVEYDGHTAVLAELWQGAGQGYQSMAVVIIGTGIGGGLILDGKLYRGQNRLAGAVGWFALTTDSGLTDPASQSIGHWESLAAGPGIARRAQALLDEYPYSLLNQASNGEPLTARQVFDAARDGDQLASRIVEETARLIGLGVANVVSLVNPEIVILGGSIGRQGDLLLPGVRAVVQSWAQPISARSVVITSSPLGADAGLYGAAYIVIERTDMQNGMHSTRHP
jgi:glucokinase